MIAQGDADKISQGNVSDDRERNTLLAMKAFIESRLAATSTPQPEQYAEQVATPASTAAKDDPVIAGDEDVEMLL